VTEIDRLVRAARRIVDRKRAMAAQGDRDAREVVVVEGIAELLVLDLGCDADERIRAEAIATARSALDVFYTDIKPLGVDRRG
jgi:tellurite resistance protein